MDWIIAARNNPNIFACSAGKEVLPPTQDEGVALVKVVKIKDVVLSFVVAYVDVGGKTFQVGGPFLMGGGGVLEMENATGSNTCAHLVNAHPGCAHQQINKKLQRMHKTRVMYTSILTWGCSIE